MSAYRLKIFFSRYKEEIIWEMFDRMGALDSPYKDFIVQSEEGRRRLRIWVDMVIRSMTENREQFFADQVRVGYARAVQGFKFENLTVYQTFHCVLWDVFRKNAILASDDVTFINEIDALYSTLFKGLGHIASSFLKTREDEIAEQVACLRELHAFTYEIIRNFGIESIVTLFLDKMIFLFGVEKCYFDVYRDSRIQRSFNRPDEEKPYDIIEIMQRTMRERECVYVDEQGDMKHDIQAYDIKRIVSTPVTAHGRIFGVLALHNSRKGFKFTHKEKELLFQFLYIVAVALENSFMMEEIDHNRHQLHLLAAKIIAIQEDERKKLAGDIHDTLAQALTGISYKIQFCKELFKRSPELLMEQFDGLLLHVNNTIDQSRQIISTLRPDLIDSMGLVPALKRHIENFMRETGITINVSLPKEVNIPSELSICLFRVAQEALANISKHAEAKSIQFSLRNERKRLILQVIDDGIGFDTEQGVIGGKYRNKFGLLSMKERVESLGGALTVDTDIDRGCRIEAILPLQGQVKGYA